MVKFNFNNLIVKTNEQSIDTRILASLIKCNQLSNEFYFLCLLSIIFLTYLGMPYAMYLFVLCTLQSVLVF